MRRYPAGVLAAILMTALLASPARAADTHAQYIEDVQPICKNGSAAAKRAMKKVRRTGDPVARFIRRTVAFRRVFKRTVKRIERVDRPPATSKKIGGWIKGLRQQKRLIDRFIAAAKRRQAARTAKIGKKAAKVQRRTIKRAKRLDLGRCAGASSAGK